MFKVIERCKETHCRDREVEISLNFKKKNQGKVDVIFLNFIKKKKIIQPKSTSTWAKIQVLETHNREIY